MQVINAKNAHINATFASDVSFLYVIPISADSEFVVQKFEVKKGGTIQPIDTSKSIVQKMAESLASRGIKDPSDRPNVSRRQKTLAQFVFGGSRERMLNLDFGSQEVSLEKGADNSHLCRTKDICSSTENS